MEATASDYLAATVKATKAAEIAAMDTARAQQWHPKGYMELEMHKFYLKHL